jgi:hypothetical protein
MLAIAIANGVIAQSTSTKSITGTVVTVDDKPAQTHVQLFSLKPKSVGPKPRGPNDPPTGDTAIGTPNPSLLQRPMDKPIKETDTDPSGKFSFTGVAPGPYVVVAGTGRNVAKVNIDVKPNEEPKPLALKLPSK